MMVYSDIDTNKKAFIFELDNVLYPEKDYLLQVYYLFAGFLEYTELLDSKVLLKLMTDIYYSKGHNKVFDELKAKLNIAEKYRQNFEHLLLNARLPLKLLLYKEMLALLQEIVIDRKQIFIVTSCNPQLQLNKIKQTEWHGLDKFLTCYFAQEFLPTGGSAINTIIKDHHLMPNHLLVIGRDSKSEIMTATNHIDYITAESFLTEY